MKDYDKESLEGTRPSVSDLEAVNFCLEQLYADTKRRITDSVVARLSFEELIGALLLARDTIEAYNEDSADEDDAPEHYVYGLTVPGNFMQRFDISPIECRFGTWAVTEYGIECLAAYYPIEMKRITGEDWARHMGEKGWVVMSDFLAALDYAKAKGAGE